MLVVTGRSPVDEDDVVVGAAAAVLEDLDVTGGDDLRLVLLELEVEVVSSE